MKLQQLRYVWEVAHHELNVSATAKSLNTSQPGISKQIRLLENELGLELFKRNGKHLASVTPVGQKIIQLIGDLLQHAESIKKLAEDHVNQHKGMLIIATTRTQARYLLPAAVEKFVAKYPDISLQLHQGRPEEIAELIVNRKVDFAFSSELLIGHEKELVSMKVNEQELAMVVPLDHELANKEQITLQDLAAYPITTYVEGHHLREGFDRALEDADIVPQINITAVDADTIKTYVKLGLGVGVVIDVACDQLSEQGLKSISVGHLFRSEPTYLCYRKGSYFRYYMYDFIELFIPNFNASELETLIETVDQDKAGLLEFNTDD